MPNIRTTSLWLRAELPVHDAVIKASTKLSTLCPDEKKTRHPIQLSISALKLKRYCQFAIVMKNLLTNILAPVILHSFHRIFARL